MLIVGTNIGYSFPGKQPLFSGLNFSFAPGSVTALTGPSGSGKSTLLSIIAGWLPPSEGRLIRSTEVQVALVTQNPHGPAQRTARDLIAFPSIAIGVSRREAEQKAQEVSEAIGIDSILSNLFGQLSGGERQRVLLARALMSSPGLLLVDEPTAQLDQASSASVREAISSLPAPNTAVVVATHDSQVAAACTSRISLSIGVPRKRESPRGPLK